MFLLQYKYKYKSLSIYIFIYLFIYTKSLIFSHIQLFVWRGPRIAAEEIHLRPWSRFPGCMATSSLLGRHGSPWPGSIGARACPKGLDMFFFLLFLKWSMASYSQLLVLLPRFWGKPAPFLAFGGRAPMQKWRLSLPRRFPSRPRLFSPALRTLQPLQPLRNSRWAGDLMRVRAVRARGPCCCG